MFGCLSLLCSRDGIHCEQTKQIMSNLKINNVSHLIKMLRDCDQPAWQEAISYRAWMVLSPGNNSTLKTMNCIVQLKSELLKAKSCKLSAPRRAAAERFIYTADHEVDHCKPITWGRIVQTHWSWFPRWNICHNKLEGIIQQLVLTNLFDWTWGNQWVLISQHHRDNTYRSTSQVFSCNSCYLS